MTKEIVKKYGINFQNRIDDDKKVDKFPGANNQIADITSLLIEWSADDIDDSDHGLLTDIDAALTGMNSEIESGTDFMQILIHQDVVDFYPAGGGEIYSIPTAELREIVVGWRDFLRTPPLNGTRV